MGSKSNISVLAISGKSRNRKIIAPSPHFIINPPPLYGIVPIFPEGHFIMTIPPPHFKIFFRNTPPNVPPSPPFPRTTKHRSVLPISNKMFENFKLT